MALDQAILVSAFKKSYCIAAYAGAIQIGEVENQEHLCFKEKKSIVVTQTKLPEFLLVLEALGRNLSVDEEKEKTENTSFQLSVNQYIVLEKCKILTKKCDHLPEHDFILEFDEFVYIEFLTAFSNVLLFITIPTKAQFLAMKKYSEMNKENTQAKLDEVARHVSTSPHNLFMLEEFLRINIPILEIFTKVLRIIGVK